MNRRSLRQGLSVTLLLLSALILGIGLLVTSPAASWAADYSAYQFSQTSTQSRQTSTQSMSQAGYGVNEDAVTVLERVSDNQSMTWHPVRFDNPPYAEGWVQEAFIDLTTADAQTQNGQTIVGDGIAAPAENRYLGNQPSLSNQQNSQRQSYSQREN